MRFPKLYECDPQKNTECNKRNCGNPCKHTTRKEFAREPSGSELLGKVVVITQMRKSRRRVRIANITKTWAEIEDAVATALARLAGRFTRRGVSECRKSASIIARSA